MQLEVGSIVEGTVSGVKKFGAFVDIDNGPTGMVHVSEISNTFVEDITTVIQNGQRVKAKVVSIGEGGKVALSIKKAVERPKESSKPKHNQGYTWHPKQQKPAGDLSFEDMMSRFKQQSDEKMSDLKKVTESRRGGASRRR